MTPQPIYTLDGCRPAYQLRWSLALFPKQPLPSESLWYEQLKAATQRDGVRILELHCLQNGSAEFLLSTTPTVKPPSIVKSVKGRLQHVMRPIMSIAFRRNFRLSSVGEATAATVERYVAKQTEHHRLGDPRSQETLLPFQLAYDHVDLLQPQNSAHGQYVTALHVVFVHAERWRIVNTRFLAITRDAILATAKKKRHRVSRLSLLADHVHFTVGIGYQAAPAELALSYMNNTAFRHGMLRMWMDSFYVGTIGPYDMNAVRRNLRK